MWFLKSNESNSEALVTLISGCIDVEFGFRPTDNSGNARCFDGRD